MGRTYFLVCIGILIIILIIIFFVNDQQCRYNNQQCRCENEKLETTINTLEAELTMADKLQMDHENEVVALLDTIENLKIELQDMEEKLRKRNVASGIISRAYISRNMFLKPDHVDDDIS
jgi:peptidoglycan hydrolase CwlO-like protein